MAKIRTKRVVKARRDRGDAFLPEPGQSDRTSFHAIFEKGDAEAAAEEFLANVTSGAFVNEDARNEFAVDELGGPFLEEEGVEEEGAPLD